MTPSKTYRSTSQYLAPPRAPHLEPGQYNIYPSFPLESGKIRIGYDSLADLILQSGQRIIVIDGFVGVLWNHVIRELGRALEIRKAKPRFVDFQSVWRSEREINKKIAPYLGGDDPLFGTRCPFQLIDFVNKDAVRQLRPGSPDEITILHGTGAALAEWKGFLVYLDVPKNEVQFRSRARSICNLGAYKPSRPGETYKRFYFVDWPVLNRHRVAILERIDCFVDHQRADEPALMSGNDLRAGLQKMATNVFRPRPWFEPGPWGGKWIKEHVGGIAKDVPNYAWSFELISPENGLAFSSDGILCECSFDFLMLSHHREVLGSFADRFGFEFPIRYDFLDTFEGGNLSVQCHPSPAYIHKHFGETFTQDECYYILDCKPDARVYLGFRNGADTEVFRKELERSYKQGSKVEIDDFVNTLPAQKHDLFLIPHGTIHCSGVNNLVLEISATPYIFTFKMYDWLRMNLDGNPRTLNIARAFENLVTSRKSDVIAQEHVARPTVIDEGSDWRLVHLATHPLHFYDVHRIEFATEVEVTTDGSVHVLNLVEGSAIEVQTKNGMTLPVGYAETFVVPAAAGSYRLVNRGPRKAFVVKTFLKPDARPFVTPEGAR